VHFAFVYLCTCAKKEQKGKKTPRKEFTLDLTPEEEFSI
jgi:hypothetical protein